MEYKIFSAVRHLLPVKQESYKKDFPPCHFICRVRIIWFQKNVCAVNLSCVFVLKMTHFLETAQWNSFLSL